MNFPVNRFSQTPEGGLAIAHHKKSAKSPVISNSFSYKLADLLNTYKRYERICGMPQRVMNVQYGTWMKLVG